MVLRHCLYHRKRIIYLIKLPRTGIEQPFMKEIPRFIDTHREFERIAVVNVSEK
jgi:hypothetical protein